MIASTWNRKSFRYILVPNKKNNELRLKFLYNSLKSVSEAEFSELKDLVN